MPIVEIDCDILWKILGYFLVLHLHGLNQLKHVCFPAHQHRILLILPHQQAFITQTLQLGLVEIFIAVYFNQTDHISIVTFYLFDNSWSSEFEIICLNVIYTIFHTYAFR